jgi:hypothetical protein
MGDGGWVLSLIESDGRAYTAVLHHRCVRDMLGRDKQNVITNLALRSGWTQPSLPGWASVVA